MSEENAFLEQLRLDPSDDVTRLVYADWLEDQGDDRCHFLRGEVYLGRLAEDAPTYADLDADVSIRAKTLPPDWLAAVGKRWDVWLIAFPRDMLICAVKTVRELTYMGLAEAKTLCESVPSPVVLNNLRDVAENLRAKFDWIKPTRYGECRVLLRPWSSDPEHYRRLKGTARDPNGQRRVQTGYLPPSSYQLVITGCQQQQEAAAVTAMMDVFNFSRGTAQDVIRRWLPYTYFRKFSSAAAAGAVVEKLGPSLTVQIRRQDPLSLPLAPPSVQAIPTGAGPFSVWLVNYRSDKKTQVVETLREFVGCGADEARDEVEGQLPIILCEHVNRSDAEFVTMMFHELGQVEVVPG